MFNKHRYLLAVLSLARQLHKSAFPKDEENGRKLTEILYSCCWKVKEFEDETRTEDANTSS
jgi:hypothetical protein